MSKEKGDFQRDVEKISQNLDALERKFLVLAKDGHPDFIQALKNSKDTLRKEGETLSRPMICAAYVGRGIGGYIENLLFFSGERRLIFSVQFGIQIIADSIRVAQREIEGKTDEDILKAKSDFGDDIFKLFKVGQRSDVQIASLLRPQALARANAEKLREDPSGFLLVDGVLKEYQSDKMKRTKEIMFPVPGLFHRGMNFGAEMYKALYPLTENLP